MSKFVDMIQLYWTVMRNSFVSYQQNLIFNLLTCKKFVVFALAIESFSSRENPPFFTERWTLLRSKFAKKKYWREYEIRTYYKKFHVNSISLLRRNFNFVPLPFLSQFKHLTGSTASTFLEYVQRNLPEGVMMIVERVRYST